MKLVWRDTTITVVAVGLAVCLGAMLADGALALPMTIAAMCAGFILVSLVRQKIDAIVLGFLLIGYIVGNRGFAQLTVVPSMPLLPAEIGLAIGGACLVWRCARDKTLPWDRTALDYVLLAWILFGVARFLFDLPRFGFIALRDFAMVYYAAFFFITGRFCEEDRTRRFLLKCLLLASAALPFVLALTELFPGFFLDTLQVHGAPLIFFKGDLAPTFLATAGILLFLCAPIPHRTWARPLAVGMIAWVFTTDNRSSAVGVLVALSWLALSRFRRFVWLQLTVLGLGLLLLVGFAYFTENAWASQKSRNIIERAMTVVDFTGRFEYQQAHSVSKRGNNQFRWVWWRTVTDETLAQNPSLGLGFGYDLARGFLQEYEPELGTDFTARSPHNILITVFARMGFVGFAMFAGILGVLTHRTWRAVRTPFSDPVHVAVWVAPWVILVSACFGVVLEGPMGAVVFWSVLGLANSYRGELEADEAPEGGEGHEEAAIEVASPSAGSV